MNVKLKNIGIKYMVGDFRKIGFSVVEALRKVKEYKAP